MPKLLIILCMILVLILIPSEARTYVVGNDVVATQKNISEAVLAASAGDIIYIKAGVYKDQVTVNKKIILKPLTGEKGQILLDGSGKGIGITLTAAGCSIEGLTFKNFTKAGILIQSDNNTIKNNQFIGDSPGIMIQNCANNRIEGNTMKDCVTGVVLWREANHNEISKNNMNGGIASITLKGAGWNAVTNNTLSNAGAGVDLENSTRVTISRNVINGGTNGIIIFNSSDCSIVNNIQSSTRRALYVLNTTRTEFHDESIKDNVLGIVLENSSNNVLRRCTVENTTEALSLGSSSKNTIVENSFLKAKNYSIEAVYSDGNVLTDNRLHDAETALSLTECSGNKLDRNEIVGANLGLIVQSGNRRGFDNSIAESNTVDGKPIVYIFNQSDKVIEGKKLSHLTLAYCKNVTVKNNTISNDALFVFSSRSNDIVGNNISNCHGVFLQDASLNNISKNTVMSNSNSGIYLFDSNSNALRQNIMAKNMQNGLSLRNSSSNTIQGNTVDKNLQTGIWFNSSKENEIFENTISNNNVGVLITASTNNQIYHNNFLNNALQAEERNGKNSWNRGNGTGGNYWSDHKVVGNPSEGSPVLIKESNTDNNPYQNENGWVTSSPAAKISSGKANKG